MNRKIKALGLALVAALAMTAVMASAAQAQFTSTATHTILSGTQKEGTNDVFTAGSGFGAITCQNATFSGTGSSTNDADQTISPSYSTCTDSFGRVVDIDNNGLKYTFTANTNAGGTSDVHVSGGMTLTVTNSNNHASPGSVICTVTITVPQTNNGIVYKNLGGTSGVEVTTNANNVKSTIEGGFFNCGTSTTNATAGTYKGTAVTTGKDTSGKAVAINVDVP